MQTRVCRLNEKLDIRVESEQVNSPGENEVRVAVGAGGICGSDLHYYYEGGFGPIQVKQPIILGHEVAGIVESVGVNVTDLAVGDRVAINPSRPCNECQYCAEELYQHCLNMRFYGSAIPYPHEQGAFREMIVADELQCAKVSSDTPLIELACSEPLSVGLHARNRAGDLKNKRVLITGAGPIGSLLTGVAVHAGALEVVVTDIHERTLKAASEMGATRTINVAKAGDALDEYSDNRGYFDVSFECSAAPSALESAINSTRPQGTIVQVGVSGPVLIPVNVLVGKEINLIGTHRFHDEFEEAAKLIANRDIDVRPILTHEFPIEQTSEAFEQAGDRSSAVKVQIKFS